MGAAFDIGEQERGAAQRLYGEILNNAEVEMVVCSVYAIHGGPQAAAALIGPVCPAPLG